MSGTTIKYPANEAALEQQWHDLRSAVNNQRMALPTITPSDSGFRQGFTIAAKAISDLIPIAQSYARFDQSIIGNPAFTQKPQPIDFIKQRYTARPIHLVCPFGLPL